VPATAPILAKTNGSVDANYLTLRDIKGEGNVTPFMAYNSVDLGNNTNWWFDAVLWNGASSGAWNTAANWNTGVVPTQYDKVVIQGGAPNMPQLSAGTPRRF